MKVSHTVAQTSPEVLREQAWDLSTTSWLVGRDFEQDCLSLWVSDYWSARDLDMYTVEVLGK